MKIQLNTDANIHGDEALASRIEGMLESALGRFSDHVTRIEVHLSDENGGKRSDPKDKRCMLEARLEGRQPVAVTEVSATMVQAVNGAAEKLARMLDSTLGKQHDLRHRVRAAPIAGDEPS